MATGEARAFRSSYPLPGLAGWTKAARSANHSRGPVADQPDGPVPSVHKYLVLGWTGGLRLIQNSGGNCCSRPR